MTHSERVASLKIEIDAEKKKLGAKYLILGQLRKHANDLKIECSWVTEQQKANAEQEMAETEAHIKIQHAIFEKMECGIGTLKVRIKQLRGTKSGDDLFRETEDGKVTPVRRGQILGSGCPSAREQQVLNGETVDPMSKAIVDLERSQRGC